MGSIPADQNKGNTNTISIVTAANPYAAFATATPQDIADQSWYFDSRATHHITNNLNNLNQATRNFGKSWDIVANREPLSIRSICSAKINTYSKAHPLLLTNMLHTPFISKNIISISQLTSQNNVTIEFDYTFFFVKDKKTKKELLQGKLRDGLYRLDTNSNNPILQVFSAFISPKSSLLHWHRILGHPSHKVLSQVPRTCNPTKKNNMKVLSFVQPISMAKLINFLFQDPNLMHSNLCS